jgi:hypothetical protein
LEEEKDDEEKDEEEEKETMREVSCGCIRFLV